MEISFVDHVVKNVSVNPPFVPGNVVQYVSKSGNPVLDNTRSHAVLTTLVSRKRGTRPGSQTPEGGYYYDPQNRRGTLLWTLTQDRLSTPSMAESFAQDGGQQLLDIKAIASFSAKAARTAPGKLKIQVTWTNPDALRNPQTVVLG